MTDIVIDVLSQNCLFLSSDGSERIIQMETRIAVISILIENSNAAEAVNEILHESAQYVIGRLGVPYREKSVNIISIAVDAPQTLISSISGKLGQLNGVQSKTAYFAERPVNTSDPGRDG